jgi:hypothetical protein
VSTEPGFPVDLVGTTELHATFREEGNPGKRSAFSWFSAKKNHASRSLSGDSNCESALIASQPNERLGGVKGN